MTVTHAWTETPPILRERLREFERQFDYPLNSNQRFRIEHSLEYERFFRAMGESVTVVTEKGGKILGVLSAVVRTLQLSKCESENWLYIGDVKIDELSRGRHVLKRLFVATQSWVGSRCSKGYSVVMDGTGVTPPAYTGRLGIPAFRAQQSIKLFALVTESLKQLSIEHAVDTISDDPRLKNKDIETPTKPNFAPHWLSANLKDRSNIKPVWLSNSRRRCFGLLEDTRHAKRLYDSQSQELLYAHLSNLQYNSIADIVPILVEAGKIAYTHGSTDLLVAVPARDSTRLQRFLDQTKYDVFSATVYSTEKTEGYELPINSSEI